MEKRAALDTGTFDEIRRLVGEAQNFCGALRGFLHLAQESSPSEELSGYLSVVDENVKRIAVTHSRIEDILSGTERKSELTILKPAVLLVDDDPVQHLFIQRALASIADISVARNGKVGFDMYLAVPHRLIIMDCQMPVVDGFQLTTAIRRYEEKTNRMRTPILAYTSHSVAGYRERCIEVGMDEYLKKPVSSLELKSVVAKYVHIEEEPAALVRDS